MKTSSPVLIDFLGSTSQFLMADLFSITLQTGTVLHYTTADTSITANGQTFNAHGPLIKRGQVRTVLGLEVDTLDMRVMTTYGNSSHTVDDVPFVEAALKGYLDGATVVLQRAFLSAWTDAPVGTVVLFSGRVSDVSGSRTEVRITVKSDIELLNIKQPRNLYQASCLHTVYDAGCLANKTALTVSGQVTGSNGTGRWLQSNVFQTAGWFDQGVITFNSGPNSGVKRTVKSFNSGQFWFALSLAHTPLVGDTFTVFPGCDKTQATCTAKFSNLSHFRGYPYIPIAETAT